jgi:hypothetical protein
VVGLTARACLPFCVPLRRENGDVFSEARVRGFALRGCSVFLFLRSSPGLSRRLLISRWEASLREGGRSPRVLGLILVFIWHLGARVVAARVQPVLLWITLGLARARFSKSLNLFSFPRRSSPCYCWGYNFTWDGFPVNLGRIPREEYQKSVELRTDSP